MAEWDKLIMETDSIDYWPEPSLAHVIEHLAKTFGDIRLKMWDLGCGRGRHTVAMAALGMDVYASDYSQNAVDVTAAALGKRNLDATLACSEIGAYPFEEDVDFHGIVCWNVLQHSTLANVENAVGIMQEHLVPGGYALLALCSPRSQGYGNGREVEQGSFISEGGREKGVLHHYFTQAELENLFDEEHWRMPALAENIVLYYDLDNEYADPNVFRSTGWLLLVERK